MQTSKRIIPQRRELLTEVVLEDCKVSRKQNNNKVLHFWMGVYRNIKPQRCMDAARPAEEMIAYISQRRAWANAFRKNENSKTRRCNFLLMFQHCSRQAFIVSSIGNSVWAGTNNTNNNNNKNSRLQYRYWSLVKLVLLLDPKHRFNRGA